MTIPIRLMEQARALAEMDPTRPRQASLRRSISTAYYSVFHLLVQDYTRMFSSDPVAQAAIGRTLNHKDITAVARDFSSPQPRLPEALKSHTFVVPPELTAVARAFPDLQDERHDADYDLSLTYTRAEALLIVSAAEQTFTNWQKTRLDPLARIFLACFQLKAVWNQKR